MERTKWIVGVRNKLSSIAMECDSVAAIETTHMTETERHKLQESLRKLVDWVDTKIRVI